MLPMFSQRGRSVRAPALPVVDERVQPDGVLVLALAPARLGLSQQASGIGAAGCQDRQQGIRACTGRVFTALAPLLLISSPATTATLAT